MQKLVSVLLPLLLLLLSVHEQASAAQVTLNATACTHADGCSFDDPSIWSTGTVPGPSDAVLLERIDANTNVTVFIRYHVEVLEIVAKGVDIHVIVGASLYTNQTVLESALLNVSGNATSVGSFSAFSSDVMVDGTLFVSGFVWFDEASLLTIVGNFSSYSADASYRGRIEALFEQSYIIFHHLNLVRTDSFFLCEIIVFDLVIGPQVDFVFSEGLTVATLTIPHNTTVSVLRHIHVVDTVHYESPSSVLKVFSVGEVYSPYFGIRTNSTISWYLSFNNTGHLEVTNSTVVLLSADSEIETVVSFVGNNTIIFEEITFDRPNSLVFVPPGTNDAVHCRVIVYALHLNTTVHIPGDILVQGIFTISRDVSVTGTVLVEEGTMYVSNATTLTCPTLWVLPMSPRKTALVLEQGAQVHSRVWLFDQGTLSTSHLADIHGDLINSGIVQVSSENRLIVMGNYYQEHPGKLAVTLVESEPQPGVFVNGTAEFYLGTLEVTSRTHKTLQYNVLQVGEGIINGTFASPVLVQSTEGEQLEATFGSKVITVSYTRTIPADEEGFWHTAWPWVIFGILGGLILVAIVVVLVRRSRKGYQPVKG